MHVEPTIDGQLIALSSSQNTRCIPAAVQWQGAHVSSTGELAVAG